MWLRLSAHIFFVFFVVLHIIMYKFAEELSDSDDIQLKTIKQTIEERR